MIDAKGLDHKRLNERVRACEAPLAVSGCHGQRFIATGFSGRQIEITGTPGNALGAVGGAMHGGRVFPRSHCADIRFPRNVTAVPASKSDMARIDKYLSAYCALFGPRQSRLVDAPFAKIVPDSQNPYKQIYVAN